MALYLRVSTPDQKPNLQFDGSGVYFPSMASHQAATCSSGVSVAATCVRCGVGHAVGRTDARGWEYGGSRSPLAGLSGNLAVHGVGVRLELGEPQAVQRVNPTETTVEDLNHLVVPDRNLAGRGLADQEPMIDHMRRTPGSGVVLRAHV